MAGLDPAIHVFGCRQKGVDARIKSGHDDSGLPNCCASTTDFAQPDSRGLDPAMTCLRSWEPTAEDTGKKRMHPSRMNRPAMQAAF